MFFNLDIVNGQSQKKIQVIQYYMGAQLADVIFFIPLFSILSSL